MYRRLQGSLGVTSVAIVIVLVCVVSFLNKIYQDEKIQLTNRVNLAVDGVLSAYNGLCMDYLNYSVGYNGETELLRIYREKNYDFSVDYKLAVDEMCMSACYDTRDTSKWRLGAFYDYLEQEAVMENIPFRLVLTDSSGFVIDSCGKVVRQHGVLEFEPRRLGLLDKHRLLLTMEFPFRQFIKNEWLLIVLFPVLFLLLIYCICILFNNIRREHIYRDDQRQFIHALVHNLRGPLATAKQLLGQPDSGENTVVLQRCVQNMGNGIDGLLALASHVHGVKVWPEWVDLPQMLAVILEEFEVWRKAKQAVFIIACPEECREIWADPVHLCGVLKNLIANALKYSDDKVEIRVSCFSAKNTVSISVCDTGFGISPEIQKRVFDIYARDKQYSGDKQRKGYGIGLTYVQKVVHAHKGKIKLRSKPGVGSEFILIFPQKRK